MSQITMWGNQDNAANAGDRMANQWGDIQNQQKQTAINNATKLRESALQARVYGFEDSAVKYDNQAQSLMNPYQAVIGDKPVNLRGIDQPYQTAPGVASRDLQTALQYRVANHDPRLNPAYEQTITTGQPAQNGLDMDPTSMYAATQSILDSREQNTRDQYAKDQASYFDADTSPEAKIILQNNMQHNKELLEGIARNRAQLNDTIQNNATAQDIMDSSKGHYADNGVVGKPTFGTVKPKAPMGMSPFTNALAKPTTSTMYNGAWKLNPNMYNAPKQTPVAPVFDLQGYLNSLTGATQGNPPQNNYVQANP